MVETKFYANISDIIKISEPLLALVTSEWLDMNDVIIGKSNTRTCNAVYMRIIGNNTSQIKARVDFLKTNSDVRDGLGVHIKEVKR